MLSLCSGWICASSARVRSRSSASLIVRYPAQGVPSGARGGRAPTGPRAPIIRARRGSRQTPLARARHQLPDLAVVVDRVDLAVAPLPERGDVRLGHAELLHGGAG